MTSAAVPAVTPGLPRPPGLFRRYWQEHPRFFDALLASVWIAVSAGSAVALLPDPLTLAGQLGPIVVGVWVAGLALAVYSLLQRRTRPMLAFAGVLLGTLPATQIEPTAAVLAVGIAIYSVAVYASAARGWLAFGVAALVTALLVLNQLYVAVPSWSAPGDTRADVAVAIGVGYAQVMLVSLLLGVNLGARRRYIVALVAHAEQLARDRDQQAQLAALSERSRIARDVHDVVAHSLSVIVRLADGAEAVFDKDPVRARDAVVQVGVTARSSLAEMRRVIGVLESGSENPAFSSQAGFADIPELIAVYRKVGLPVELTITGEAPAAAGVQLAVFRVVQEALTNALRYSDSPSAVSVRIDVTRDVEVLVVNDGVAATRSTVGSGRGVLGMRERAALYGGTVECGPVGEDSWRVWMLLPGAGREQSR